MNVLTQASMTAICDMWQRVADLTDTGSCSALQGADLWVLVANSCEAYSIQHAYAQMHDEAQSFTWLQDMAEQRAAMTRATGQPSTPKLQLVSALGMPLK